MKTDQARSAEERLERAYERMMERARAMFDHAREETLPNLQDVIDEAKEKTVELGELTREEAEKIAEYLRRDLHDAAAFLTETRQGLAEWLRFDLAMVESRIADIFSTMVDHTRVELARLAEQARRAGDLHTGEIVSPGTLECVECGKAMHFHAAGRVPPCPKCHGTAFRRPRSG